MRRALIFGAASLCVYAALMVCACNLQSKTGPGATSAQTPTAAPLPAESSPGPVLTLDAFNALVAQVTANVKAIAALDLRVTANTTATVGIANKVGNTQTNNPWPIVIVSCSWLLYPLVWRPIARKINPDRSKPPAEKWAAGDT